MTSSSDVSVLGLGAMGAAIARALLGGGFRVTVWNRSEARRQSFENSGADVVATAEAAIAASPVCIICIDDYDASSGLLERTEAEAAIGGRTILQFSTGTPAEARRGKAWADSHDANWLDGAILAYPREVGESALICVAGSDTAHKQCEPLLACLSSDIRYLGAAVGAAAALDIAVLSYYICTHLGLVHGAMICQAEHVPVTALSAIIIDSQPGDKEEIANLGNALNSGDFANPGASLGVYHGVLKRIISQAESAGLNSEIPQFAASIIERGMQAGLEDEEVVAVIKVLNKQSGGGN